jgi:hypothetical protein
MDAAVTAAETLSSDLRCDVPLRLSQQLVPDLIKRNSCQTGFR